MSDFMQRWIQRDAELFMLLKCCRFFRKQVFFIATKVISADIFLQWKTLILLFCNMFLTRKADVLFLPPGDIISLELHVILSRPATNHSVFIHRKSVYSHVHIHRLQPFSALDTDHDTLTDLCVPLRSVILLGLLHMIFLISLWFRLMIMDIRRLWLVSCYTATTWCSRYSMQWVLRIIPGKPLKPWIWSTHLVKWRNHFQ